MKFLLVNFTKTLKTTSGCNIESWREWYCSSCLSKEIDMPTCKGQKIEIEVIEIENKEETTCTNCLNS